MYSCCRVRAVVNTTQKRELRARASPNSELGAGGKELGQFKLSKACDELLTCISARVHYYLIIQLVQQLQLQLGRRLALNCVLINELMQAAQST